MALLREAGIGAVAGPAVATISDNLEDARAAPLRRALVDPQSVPSRLRTFELSRGRHWALASLLQLWSVSSQIKTAAGFPPVNQGQVV